MQRPAWSILGGKGRCGAAPPPPQVGRCGVLGASSDQAGNFPWAAHIPDGAGMTMP